MDHHCTAVARNLVGDITRLCRVRAGAGTMHRDGHGHWRAGQRDVDCRLSNRFFSHVGNPCRSAVGHHRNR